MPEGSENGVKRLDHTQTGADAAVEFGEIEFAHAGEYEYQIAEVSGNDETITYDTSLHTVKYIVTLNEATNKLEAARQIDGDTDGTVAEIVIENKYTSSPDSPGDDSKDNPADTNMTGDELKSDNVSDSVVRTGDENNFILWSALLILVAGAATSIVIRRKKSAGDTYNAKH